MAKENEAASAKQTPSIAEHLMHSLQHGGLEKAHLAQIVKSLDEINRQGVQIHRVLTKGTPPIFDTVVAYTTLTPQSMANLLGVLKTVRGIDNIIVFPYGIPAIEHFQAEITVR